MPKALLLLLLLVTAHYRKPITQTGSTVATRFKVPAGFSLLPAPKHSFGEWLLRQPLKPAGTPTLTYSGAVARTNRYTAAVLNISVGKNGLQQCADATIRLIAEYLYSKKTIRHFTLILPAVSIATLYILPRDTATSKTAPGKNWRLKVTLAILF